MLFGLMGCSGNVNQTDYPSTYPPTESTDNPIDVLPTQPNVTKENLEVSSGAKNIWEKDYQEFTLEDFVLGADWYERVNIGDIDVYSTEMIDASKLPNYYYKINGSHADLETMYYIPTVCLSVNSSNYTIGKWSTVTSIVDFTTYLQFKDNVALRNPIVEKIKVSADTNIYEGGLNELTGAAKFSTQSFGIGSTYRHVSNLIGEPTNVLAEDWDEMIHAAMCIYVANDAELLLTFVWDADKSQDEAILIEINWIPTTVRTILRSQETLSTFENYNKIYNSTATSE
jgi:hypothetical protein